MKVRVRKGATLPDLPDIPLGGWAGTVTAVFRGGKQPTYQVTWNQRTLDNMPPVYRNRSEREGCSWEVVNLEEQDIEPDAGELVQMEQPTDITPRPLQPDDEDDRIRTIFGLTSDDPLPAVTEESLARYHEYLATHLVFPFQATCADEGGPLEFESHVIDVLGLLDPDEYPPDEFLGLLCEVRGQKGQDDKRSPAAGPGPEAVARGTKEGGQDEKRSPAPPGQAPETRRGPGATRRTFFEKLLDMIGFRSTPRSVLGQLVEEENLLPLAQAEVLEGSPNRQLIADYSYWFWNHR